MHRIKCHSIHCLLNEMLLWRFLCPKCPERERGEGSAREGLPGGAGGLARRRRLFLRWPAALSSSPPSSSPAAAARRGLWRHPGSPPRRSPDLLSLSKDILGTKIFKVAFHPIDNVLYPVHYIEWYFIPAQPVQWHIVRFLAISSLLFMLLPLKYWGFTVISCRVKEWDAHIMCSYNNNW